MATKKATKKTAAKKAAGATKARSAEAVLKGSDLASAVAAQEVVAGAAGEVDVIAIAAHRIELANEILAHVGEKIDAMEKRGESRQDLDCAAYTAFMHCIQASQAGRDEDSVVEDLRSVLHEAKDATPTAV